MTLRFFPVSVAIRGDIGVADRTVIDDINQLIRAGLEARGEAPDRFEVSILEPGQFVIAKKKPRRKR